MEYVSRAAWGAQSWRPQREMYAVPMTERTEHLTHYHGGPPKRDRGVEMAREIEAIHLANGWAGVGYNWLVGQDGVIYEGRGWSLVGAHCPKHNRVGIGTYVAVGGHQVPSDAALRAVDEVYDEACRRARRGLRKTYHGANYPTECPGVHLRAWVKTGMPRPPDPQEDDDMQLAELAGWDISALVGLPPKSVNFQTAFARMYAASQRPAVDVQALAAAVVKHLPVGSVSASDIADELSKRLEA